MCYTRDIFSVMCGWVTFSRLGVTIFWMGDGECGGWESFFGWVWVSVGGYDLFLGGVSGCRCVWPFLWLHVGECDLFLAGFGCLWVSVNFFWLDVCGFGWVWPFLAGCGWVWLSARFITTHKQHIWDKTHNSNENAPYKKDLLTSINFLPMSLLSSFWEKHHQLESDPMQFCGFLVIS